MSDSERLRKIINLSKKSTKAFSEDIGLKSPQILYDVLKGRNGISKELANSIKAKCVNYNLAWLLTGEGEMLVGAEKKEEKAATPLALLEIREKFDVKEDRLLAIIESQQRTIETLSQTNKKILAQAEDNATCADAAGSEFKK